MTDRVGLDRPLLAPTLIPASTLSSGKSLSWEFQGRGETDEGQVTAPVASLRRSSPSHHMEKVKTRGFSPGTEARGAGLLEHLQVAGGENTFFKSIPVGSVCVCARAHACMGTHTSSRVSSFVYTLPGPVLPFQTPSALQVQPSLLPKAT